MEIFHSGRKAGHRCAHACCAAALLFLLPRAVHPQPHTELIPQFFAAAGIHGTLYTGDTAGRAPSPISFSAAAGLRFPPRTSAAFEPRLAFFVTHMLWDGTQAQPAEIEHRTAAVYNFLLDLPAVYSITYRGNVFSVGAGVAFLLRGAALAHGVSETDDGASANAGTDTERIGEWLWQSGRFVYPELLLSWSRQNDAGLGFGLDCRMYYPISPLFTGKTGRHLLDTAMLSVSFRVTFPYIAADSPES